MDLRTLLALLILIPPVNAHSLSAALEEVQRSGTVVYAVDYPGAFQTNASSEDLRRLTDETGGILFDPPGEDYSEIISRVAADLHGRYILGFRPESSASETRNHSLKVEVLAPERRCGLAANTPARSSVTRCYRVCGSNNDETAPAGSAITENLPTFSIVIGSM